MAAGGKSKIVAGLLGILLGAFGAHQFYLGNIKGGVIRLIVAWLTCGWAPGGASSKAS